MHARDLLRLIPGLSRLVSSLESHERQSRLLTAECWRLAAENHRLKAARRGPRVAEPAVGGGGEPPLPPPVLRLFVAGTDAADWFLFSGRLGAESLISLLAKNHIAVGDCRSILDFGCGCGRVIRHLGHLSARLFGCDTNPVAVEWCEEHLPPAAFAVNALEPPLPYADASFDLVYSLSVFTHLPSELQLPWMAELRRVLRPGGTLVLSLHGDATTGHLSRAERADYRAGRLVVRVGELAGTNHCAAFHPSAFVRGVLAEGFEVLDQVPEGATGNPPQDAWVLRKPA
jgi:SAM-dependent methyltransferase